MFSKAKLFDVVVFVLLIAFEGLLCYSYFKREIAWYPPSNFDQSDYLATSYAIEKKTHAIGPFELLRAVGSKAHFTGAALPIEGAVSGLILGRPRLARLLVLFLSYCALQIACFLTARSIWNSRAYGYMALGLILCQITPWYWSGGLFDFRLDFIASCLYGVWVCTVLRSRIFLDRRWSIGCGAIAGFLVLNRFLTLIFVVGVSAAFAVFCLLVQFLARADKDLAKRMRSRVYNVIISLALTGLIVGPFLFRSWSEWYGYYFVNHATKETSGAWARLVGLTTNFSDQLLFYPKCIVRDHWGSAFMVGLAIALAICIVAAMVAMRKPKEAVSTSNRDEVFLLQLIFLLGAIFGPLVVLLVDTVKAPDPASIVNAPSALLAVCLVAASAPHLPKFGLLRTRNVISVCAFIILVLGMANVFTQSSQHLWEYAQRSDLKRMVELHKWLVDYARKRGWQNPAVSTDVLSPWLQGTTISDTGYERLGQLVEFRPMLGHGIMSVDRSDALSLLANSDLAIFTDSPKPGMTLTGLSVDASGDAIREFPTILLGFPFGQKLASYRDDLIAWAEENMTLVKSEQFENFRVRIYARSVGASPGN